MEYIAIMRQRLGYEASDNSHDEEIKKITPMKRVKLISGWYLGDERWAEYFKEYFESQGLYLTTDPNSKGII